ncbi:hypothetical protein [Fictibacillus enclensis]|uniref:hypothetical protein n=1 Tax=Fictibacillus enclensis TaxID=1017270 RepID=UPI000781FB6F|nr:hypothetical protein [Fictibacillus enclensis]
MALIVILSVGTLSLPLLVEADVVRLFGCKVVLTRQELSYHRFISFGKLFFKKIVEKCIFSFKSREEGAEHGFGSPKIDLLASVENLLSKPGLCQLRFITKNKKPGLRIKTERRAH